ncbi:MAG: alkaline phosphatase family protein [Chitinophagaceae bacterium]|nr:MAG: alkaline phosphatase family protein [Chitinophagaceae bacterium]
MFRRLLFLIIYIFSWIAFFELARIFFLLYEWQYTSQTPAGLTLQSLWYGLKMDLSMASYISVPVCLFTIAGLFIPFFQRGKIYSIYTGIILFVQFLLIVVDVEIFRAWGHRIDFTPLKYLSNPREVWASVSHLPIVWILLGLIIVYLLLLWIFRKVIYSSIRYLQNRKLKWVQTLVVLIFTGALIIPIRGGFQLSPLNQSSVFFSNNQFANNAALNASWNFMYSITLMNSLNRNPYEYMKEEEANNLVKNLFTTDNRIEQVVNVSDSSKTNIIIIVWESFTEKALHVNFDGKPVAPFFELLKKEGIYFSNCYSSGDRTDKGISSILSAYPALPKGSIVNYPEKTAKLPGLGEVFLNKGYSTHFYYGGEPEFANIKSYLTAQKFQQFVTVKDFEKKDLNSKWGAHDEVVMKRLLNDLPAMKQPYFTTWLTLSSHEPFETPVPAVFHGKDIKTRFMNSLHYTDSCLYVFINELKKLPTWNNTLVIISADHGHYEPMTGKRADDYHIPVLWLGGALKKKDVVVEKTVDQLDIAGTVVQQLGFKQNPFVFGKNYFDSSAKHWAFFTYNDGIGFVTDSSRILFDNAGRRVVFEEGKVGKEQADIAKALMQVLYADFLKR